MTKDAYVDLDSFQTYAGPVIRVFPTMKVTYFFGARHGPSLKINVFENQNLLKMHVLPCYMSREL